MFHRVESQRFCRFLGLLHLPGTPQLSSMGTQVLTNLNDIIWVSDEIEKPAPSEHTRKDVFLKVYPKIKAFSIFGLFVQQPITRLRF